MTVSWVPIEELVVLTRRAVEVDPVADYKFLGVSAGGRGCFMKPAVKGSEIRSRAFMVRQGDFLYSRLFAWKGSFEVVEDAHDGCLVSGEFPTFRVDEQRLDARWLRYWLLSSAGLREVVQRSAGSTPGSRNRLREDKFLAISIPLPSLDEQRRVVSHLVRIDEATRRLAECSNKSASLLDALAVAMCARPDLSEVAKEREGWQLVRLGSVMSLDVDPVEVSSLESYPNLGIFSFGRGVFEKPAIDGSETTAKTLNRIREGQFIYSRLFAFEGAYAYVPRVFDGHFVSNEFPTFRTDQERLDARWLATHLRSPTRWRELASRGKGLGVRRQRVHVEAILDYRVWLPPVEVQQSTMRLVERLREASEERMVAESRIQALLPASVNREFAKIS